MDILDSLQDRVNRRGWAANSFRERRSSVCVIERRSHVLTGTVRTRLEGTSVIGPFGWRTNVDQKGRLP
jgi:hypothetical protein